jgi:hypothetical protein
MSDIGDEQPATEQEEHKPHAEQLRKTPGLAGISIESPCRSLDNFDFTSPKGKIPKNEEAGPGCQ